MTLHTAAVARGGLPLLVITQEYDSRFAKGLMQLQRICRMMTCHASAGGRCESAKTRAEVIRGPMWPELAGLAAMCLTHQIASASDFR